MSQSKSSIPDGRSKTTQSLVSNLNDGDIQFLEILQDNDWEADTSTIRKNTDLNNNEITHRRTEKFNIESDSDYDWVKYENNGTENGAPAPSTVIVVDQGAVENALVQYQEKSKEFRNFGEAMEKTSENASELQSLKNRISKLEDQQEELEDIFNNRLTEENDELREEFNVAIGAILRLMGEDQQALKEEMDQIRDNN